MKRDFSNREAKGSILIIRRSSA